MDTLAELVLSLLNPWVMFIVAGLATIFWIRLLLKYPHICFNRYDTLLVVVALGGMATFELSLILYTIECGELLSSCVNLVAVSAFSRVMRLAFVLAMLVVGHAAALRQRAANRIVQEVLNGTHPSGV